MENNTRKYLFNWEKISLLEVTGKDAKDFLHRLSTVSFKQHLSIPIYGAFLNGQGKLISLFTAFETAQDQIQLFVEPSMLSATQKYLEQMHFSEDLKIAVQPKFCLEFRNEKASRPEAISAYNWGIPGFYLFTDSPIDTKQFSDYRILSQEKFDALRAQYGFAKPLQDLTNDHLLLEAGLEDWIDRNKGCYPGQEVVEKIYTYGRLPRKITRVTFSKKLDVAIPFPIEVHDESVGIIT